MNTPDPETTPSSEHDAAIMGLLTSHQGMMYAYILSIHPNRVAAQDILQETSMVLWKKRALFEPGTNFKAWSFRFARFQTLAYLKRVKSKSWMIFSDELVETMSEEAEHEFNDFEDRRRALKECLGKLRTADQELVRAHYQSGLPLADLGSRLGRTRAALKQALLRLRRSLRTCIDREIANLPESQPNS